MLCFFFATGKKPSDSSKFLKNALPKPLMAAKSARDKNGPCSVRCSIITFPRAGPIPLVLQKSSRLLSFICSRTSCRGIYDGDNKLLEYLKVLHCNITPYYQASI